LFHGGPRPGCDGRLIALNAMPGEELWTSILGDPGVGEYLVSAPVVWNGRPRSWGGADAVPQQPLREHPSAGVTLVVFELP